MRAFRSAFYPVLLSAGLLVTAPTAQTQANQFQFCGVLAVGTITTTCRFGLTGTFVGNATFVRTNTSAAFTVTGAFTGVGSMADFVRGEFNINDPDGSLYLYSQQMSLLGTGATTGREALTWSAQTLTIPRMVNARVRADGPGFVLPAVIGRGLQLQSDIQPGPFTGPGEMRGDVSFFAESGQTFQGSLTYLLQSGPVQIIPEPSSFALSAAGLLTIAIGMRYRQRNGGRVPA